MKSSFDACLLTLKKLYENNPKIEFELTSAMIDNGITFYCSIHDKDDGYVKFSKGLSPQEAFVKSLYFYLTGEDLKENIYAQ